MTFQIHNYNISNVFKNISKFILHIKLEIKYDSRDNNRIPKNFSSIFYKAI